MAKQKIDLDRYTWDNKPAKSGVITVMTYCGIDFSKLALTMIEATKTERKNHRKNSNKR